MLMMMVVIVVQHVGVLCCFFLMFFVIVWKINFHIFMFLFFSGHTPWKSPTLEAFSVWLGLLMELKFPELVALVK